MIVIFHIATNIVDCPSWNIQGIVAQVGDGWCKLAGRYTEHKLEWAQGQIIKEDLLGFYISILQWEGFDPKLIRRMHG